MPKKATSKPRATHFLCLPLLTPESIPQLAVSLASLKRLTYPNSSSEPPHDGNGSDSPLLFPECVIPEAAYRPLGTLHLTLCVMSLPTKEIEEAAFHLLRDLDLSELLSDAGERRHPPLSSWVDLMAPEQQRPTEAESSGNMLQSLAHRITPPSSRSHASATRPTALAISLRGLSAFPNPDRATVLHAPPHDPTGRLQNFCIALRQRFIDAGLAEPEHRGLVLHATLVNTVYAKKSRGWRNEGVKRGSGKITMNVRRLLDVFNHGTGKDEAGNEDEDGDGEGRRRRTERVWAEAINVNRVRICKMGAKKVEDEVLKQEYEVAYEKLIVSSDT